MRIVGLLSQFWISSATLLKDGKVIAGAAEERFNREKVSRKFPHAALDYCLKEGKCSIEDIGGSQSVMNIPSRRADVFGEIGKEGDNIMLNGLLDFFDSFDAEIRLGADFLGNVLRDVAVVCERLEGGEFDLKPLPDFIFFCPDPAHFGPRVSFDHSALFF